MRAHVVARAATLGLASLFLFGCGAAAKAPATANETAVVDLKAIAAPEAKPKSVTGAKEKADEGVDGDVPDPALARAAALRDAAEFGRVGILGSVDSADLAELVNQMMGTSGGIAGGILGGGGGGTGVGGLGVRGAGVSAGGSAGTGTIGLGSIGTIGHGGGVGSYPGGLSSYSSSGSGSMPGQSILVSGNAVVELGEATTLGVSPEQATRVLRERMSYLRNCYADRLAARPGLAGRVALRLIVGKDGTIAATREVESTLGDGPFLECIAKQLEDKYVAVPSGGFFGVVEVAVSFRLPPRP